PAEVDVIAVLQKRETADFYQGGRAMKTMTVFEARNHFARTLEAAKDDLIIVTRNGEPVAAIQAIGGDAIEDLLPERSAQFWGMIARARRGKPIASETLRKQVAGRPTRRPAAAARTRRSRDD